VPVILAALLLLGMLVMPQILSGDGSPEGELRLFLLYAGQSALISLSLLGVGYAVWSEAQERRLGVDQLIATRPVGFTTLLSGRILALLSLLLILAVVDIGLLIGVAWQGVHGRYEETLSGPELKERLLKVHRFKSLYYLGEEGELRPKGGKVEKKVKMKPRVFHLWDLPLHHNEKTLEVSGRLLSVDADLDILLELRVQTPERALWRETLTLRTGQPFRFNLPPALQNHNDLRLMIRQANASDEPLIYTSHHPFRVRAPGGSLSENASRALFKLSLLWLYLLTLAFVMARLLPPQSSLLPIGFVTLIGTFHASIQETLFPMSKIPKEFQPGLGLGDILYLILWKPLLSLIPDFQALNPISALARGERVSFEQLPSQMTGVLFLLAVAFIITRYLLPRRERLPRR
jgi:hypothetical protein